MKYISLAVVLLLGAVSAGADDPRLATEVDAAIRGFAAAQEAADAGDATKTASEVKTLNDRWTPFCKDYRDTGTMDEKWKGDFDAVTAAIEMASAQLSRKEPLASVAAELKKGKGILEALRERNAIPIPVSDLQEVISALEQMETAAKSWSRPGSAPPGDVNGAIQSLKEAWDAARLSGGDDSGGRFRPAGDVAAAAMERLLADTIGEVETNAERGRPLLFKAALDRCLTQARQLNALRTATP